MREYFARAVPVCALACSAIAGIPPVAEAQAEAPAADQPAQLEVAAPVHVTKVRSVRPPRRKVVHKRFKPAARPGPRGVRRIIHLEARRWNISPSSLSRRVACESNYRWYAGNGAYQGLLQFASSTFYRGLRSIRSRKVKFVRERRRMVRGLRILHYSDAFVKRKRGMKRRQKVVTVYRGTLPRNPAVTHAWTSCGSAPRRSAD